MSTIAFIDRFPIIRTGAEILLKDNLKGFTILTAKDIVDFRDQYPGQKPDVLILGIDSKAITNPFILIPTIKNLFECPVIVYDDIPADQLCLKYFSAGANGYLSKSNPRMELIDSIHSILQKKNYATSEALEIFIKYLPNNGKEKETDVSKLTGHEYTVAKHLSKGMEVSSIAMQLQTTSSSISAAKKRIFKKLNVSNIVKLNAVVDGRSRMEMNPLPV